MLKMKIYRVIPMFTICLFICWLLLVLNFNEFVVFTHPEYYYEVNTITCENVRDGLFGIFNQVNVTYEWDGQVREGHQLLIFKPLFAGEIEKVETIKVNSISPDNFMFCFHFYDSVLNIILSAVLVYCFCIMLVNIERTIKSYEEVKRSKRLALTEGEDSEDESEGENN